ncbi:MAG: tRNA uridine-5-carboxymethylaminomethyl(34) synthesis GTPase MnmE [Bacilli bacterium]|nr:tRNA uridine-5-carboxymethylaminomethyl(34) synthesis GTPase MnmE [Bacilli bacterium]
MFNGDIIVALATPPFKSALALIRCSGAGVFDLVQSVFSKNLGEIHRKTMVYGTIVNGGDPVDEVMLFLYPSTSSVTGEDVVEITCHGSMLIANEIISIFLSKGARYATKGEFTARSFYNGKTDLIKAEAVNDLINSTTKEAKNINLMALSGKSSNLIKPLKKEIADLLSLIEVNIDYPEYTDLEDANEKKIIESIDEIRSNIIDLLTQGEAAKIIKDGVRVAIVGQPNAGKSSLLNAFLKEDKAIVTDIPGTTRDIVEGDVVIGGVVFHLLDTAGIRESSESIEAIGIKKSLEAISNSDIVILVVDATKGLVDDDLAILNAAKDKTTIIVMNKADLVSNENDKNIKISAKNGDISSLIAVLKDSLHLEEKYFTTPSLSNERQLNILKNIDKLLSDAREDSVNQAPIDFVSASLLSAYRLCEELLGETKSLDLTDEIFSRFCVGK